MMLSIVSCFTFAQETPVADQPTEEQVTQQEPATEEKPTDAAEQPTEEVPTAEQPTPTEEAPPAETPSETPQAPAQEQPTTPTETPSEEVPPAETPSPEQAPTEQPAPTEETPSEEEAAPTEEVLSPEQVPQEEQPTAPEEEKTPEVTPTETAPSEAIPVLPKLVEELEKIIPEETAEPEEAPAGIDTVSLEHPQGNWLFKRIWWERAEDRYEKIRLLVDAVWELRNKFFIERNTLDRKILDPFYINIGIDQGELQIILSEINDFFEKQREQQGALTEQERMLYESYTTEEETLRQLKTDVDTIAKLDHEIDNALGTLMDQINRVRNFETQSWNNFKEIAHILNDTRARELYYMIEGAARNIKNISNYLEQEFFAHFTKLVNDATSRVTRVQNQIEALKEKGIKFQRQTELLEQQQKELEEEEEEEEEVKPKPKLGWFGWIASGFSTVFNYIWSIIRLPYDLIFGK